MRVLISGCGYLGSAVGAELARRGHQVWGLRRSEAADAELRSIGVAPLHGDITRPEALAALPAEYDWVVHCVSASGGGVNEYRRVYLEGTRHVIEYFAPAALRKFVYTGSTGVYGQNDGSWVEENSAVEPAAETAKVLVETERMLLEAVHARRFPAIILRLAGIYGPGRGYWLRQFRSGEARLEAAGERFLNMIHRDDAAGAVLTALERGQPGRIYNVVDEEPVSQLSLFQWLATRLGRDLPPKDSKPLPSTRAATNKRISNRRLREELGYRFIYPTFREGFEAELARAG